MHTIEIIDWNYPDNKLPSRRTLELLGWHNDGGSILACDEQSGNPRVVDLHQLSLDVLGIKLRESGLKRGIPASIERVALIIPPVIGDREDLEHLRSGIDQSCEYRWEISRSTTCKLVWEKDDIKAAKRKMKASGGRPEDLDNALSLPTVERFLNTSPCIEVLKKVVVDGWLEDQGLIYEDVERAGEAFVRWLGVNAYNEKVGPDNLVANRDKVVAKEGYWAPLLAMVGYVMTFTDGTQLYLEDITEREPSADEASTISVLTGGQPTKAITGLEIMEAMGKALPRKKKLGEAVSQKTFDRYCKLLKINPPYTMDHKQEMVAAVQKRHEKVRRGAAKRTQKRWDKKLR